VTENSTTKRPLHADRAEWPAAARDYFEERAAILQYDNDPQLSRAEAEKRAEAEARIWWEVTQ